MEPIFERQLRQSLYLRNGILTFAKYSSKFAVHFTFRYSDKTKEKMESVPIESSHNIDRTNNLIVRISDMRNNIKELKSRLKREKVYLMHEKNRIQESQSQVRIVRLI